MKHFLKKTKELWVSWAANEKNWFTIGITGRSIYFAALFCSLIKILAQQSNAPHREDVKDMPAMERFQLFCVFFIWMYPMISMILQFVEDWTRKRPAARQTFVVYGNTVQLVNELDFSFYARLFHAIRIFIALIFLTGATHLCKINHLQKHNLMLLTIIVVLDIFGRLVEHFSLGKVYRIREKLLNDSDQAKLFERIEEIMKQERNKLEGLDKRPLVIQQAETKLDIIVLEKLVNKIQNPIQNVAYKEKMSDLFGDIEKSAENQIVPTRSDVGLKWYKIGRFIYTLTIASKLSMYVEPCLVSMFTEHPDYPYTIYLWLTAYFVLHLIFFRANTTEHGFPGSCYARILHYRLFVAFGQHATEEAKGYLKKTIGFSLFFSIIACGFYHFSLIIGTELKLFIALNSIFLVLCFLTFYCFSKFVNSVIEAESLVPGDELKEKNGDVESTPSLGHNATSMA